jgi:SEC-C motif-containing protein
MGLAEGIRVCEGDSCPCGSGHSYVSCCHTFHSGKEQALNCEALMRSRYCAFVTKNGQYLFDTHHPEFRGADTAEDFLSSTEKIRWLRLQVLASKGDELDDVGWVKFNAWFIENSKVFVHSEYSQFQRYKKRWVYTTGEYLPAQVVSVGRNDRCICGSEKKFKKCCGK